MQILTDHFYSKGNLLRKKKRNTNNGKNNNFKCSI